MQERKPDAAPGKPWVFIIGGTGETLSADAKQFAAITEEIENLEKQRSQYNSLMKDKGTLETLMNAELENRAEEEDINEGIQNREQIISKHKDLQILDEQITEIDSKISQLSYPEDRLIELNTKLASIIPNLTPTYKAYLPPFDTEQKTYNSHIQFVEGVKAPLGSSKFKDRVSARQFGAAAVQTAKDTYDYITANSEKKRIQECMQSLAEAENNNQLPDKIVLNGHSRGASSCIELSRAIYLKYGDKIKIDMNINDPVPGPLRHGKSKKVIPPNVESLIITYAANEDSKLFKPQNLHKIFYDKEKTAVTAVVLPTRHIEAIKDEKIRSINRSFWNNVIHNKEKPLPFSFHEMGATQKTNLIQTKDSLSTQYVNISESRNERVFFKTDVSAVNNPAIQAFHQSLTSKEPTVDQLPVASKTTSSLTGQEELDRIYNEGRAALAEKNQKVKAEPKPKERMQVRTDLYVNDVNKELKKLNDPALMSVKRVGISQEEQWINLQKDLNKLRVDARSGSWPLNKTNQEKNQTLKKIDSLLTDWKVEIPAEYDKEIKKDLIEKKKTLATAKKTAEIKTENTIKAKR